ncbi:phage tail family protein [Streptomyces sp. 8L]|uniref:phage tail family protein n=1 Tax=Streptomyces sp. 8L TaxID=2877242 RepID=UPI001CD689DD|nr:phage tail family protein [Streptomyces sp. 8L]MCA1219886.1 phage tail family protein [Streptomyces sp. 8L]
MAAGDRVTRPGHVQYGDFLMGPGTPYRWQSLTGWEDLPGLDSGTVLRADAHGAFPGQLLAQTRTVVLDGLIIRARRDSIGAAIAAVSTATVPVDDELPLVAWLDERGPLLVRARATRRAIPVGRGYRAGTITGGAIQWEATDPRRYEMVERTAAGGLPVAEPGLAWPLAWPLSFGTPGSTGALTAANDGNAPTHPVIEFRGPVARPSLTNVSSGDVLEYDLPLTARDVLTVDTSAGTVVLNGTASRIYTATARSVPEQTFTFPPGPTPLIFRAAPGSSDPSSSATVRYRSAYW